MANKSSKKKSTNSNDEQKTSNISNNSSNFTNKKTTPSKTEEKSVGSTSWLFWVIFIMVTGGLSFSFKMIMDENNDAINEQLSELQNKLLTMSNSQVDLKQIESLTESISDLKKSLNSYKQEMTDMSVSLKTYESSISDLMMSMATLETSNADLQEKTVNLERLHNENLESKEMIEKSMMTLEEKMQQSMSRFSSLETNVAAFSEEIFQLSNASKSDQNKISSLENNIATISVSVSKVEDKLKQLEQKSDVRYASFEENRKIFEDGLSEKTLFFEKKITDEMSDMLTQVQNSQTQATSLRSELNDGVMNLKRELSAANTRSKQESQQREQNQKKTVERLDAIDLALEQLQTDPKESDIESEVENITDELDSVSIKLRLLEETLKHFDTKAESQYKVFFKKIKESSEEMSKLRNDLGNFVAVQSSKVVSQGKPQADQVHQ